MAANQRAGGGLSAETKPVPGQTCMPGPSDSSSSLRELRRGPWTMGGLNGRSRNWRGSSVPAWASSLWTLDLFLPFAQLQCSWGVGTPCVLRNTNSFSLVSQNCSPQGVGGGDSHSGPHCGEREAHPGFTSTCSEDTGRYCSCPGFLQRLCEMAGTTVGFPLECLAFRINSS